GVDVLLGELVRLPGVVAARAGQNRDAAAGRLDLDLHDARVLLLRQRRIVAGGAERHEEVDPFADLPLDEALQRGIVERAGLLEWGNESSSHSAKFHDITSSSNRKNPFFLR